MVKKRQLTSFELQPEAAHPDIQWALKEMGARKRTDKEIREELNTRLLAIEGASPISQSAFNRKSMSLAKIGTDIQTMREMAAVFADKQLEMPDADVGMLITEMLKSVIYTMVQDIAANDFEVSAKLVKEISLSTLRLELAGQISAKRAIAITAHAKQAAQEAVDAVAATLPKERGLSDDVVNQIKAQILGVT